MPAKPSVANVDPDRSPCLPIAAAFAAGAAADHALRSPVLLVSAVGVSLTILLCFYGPRRPVRVAVLLFLYVALGAAGHRAAWSDRASNSVTRLTSLESKLVRLTGVVAEAPTLDRRWDAGRRAAWRLDDRSRTIIAVESVDREEAAPLPVSGRIQLTTAGHLIHVAPGDYVQVTGWLVRSSGPRNPGGFDAEEHLRRQGMDGVLYVDHPDAVRRIDRGAPGWRRLAGNVRDRLSMRFAEHLSTRNGAVGAAMILGDRSAMPLDVRDAYVASGAMHILAISGLNVGIFAVFLTWIGRLLNLPSVAISAGVVACVWAYAALTNLEPPVVRASVFLTVWAAAASLQRRSPLLNTAAATAVLLLFMDPLLLFDLGAQLSFLAVLGMSWTTRALPRTRRLFAEAAETRSGWATVGRWLFGLSAVSFGTWLFTAPLIAARFQMVSFVGLPLNVVLVPLVTGVMWIGYAFFAACLMVPWAAAPFGAAFDLGLTLTNGLVAIAGAWRFGHVSTPSIPAWWIVGFYLLLALGLLRPMWLGRRIRSLTALLIWSVVGLAGAGYFSSDRQQSLRLTVLDVGHGGAILVETPSGRRMLFDCGSMEDDRQAAETVWRAVRERGGTTIDLLVLSHADSDHCNNAPFLLRGGPIGTTLVARSFLDLDQKVVDAACVAARETGSKIRLVAAGDAIRLDPAVLVSALHPSDRAPGEDDNANSIVLRIEYAGRTLLLTGDVEGPGQAELFEREPARRHDVVVSPHHG